MLTKIEQAELRSLLFRHLDGIVTAPLVYALNKKGVLEFLVQHQQVEIAELATHFKANEGYLNVALRVLCSQGWLMQEVDNLNNKVYFSTNQKSKFAFKLASLYDEVVELMKYSANFHPRKFEKQPFQKLSQIFKKYQSNYGLVLSYDKEESMIQQQVLNHIEGAITGPTVVLLGMGGMFHKYFMQASFRAEEYHKDGESFQVILDFFTYLGWFDKKNDTYRFSEKGLFYAKRASAYGVTVSYIPTLRNLDELIFGNPEVLKSKEGEGELHVDREMNVWGSGGAHASYFKKVDDIIIELFNRPIEEQPKGVLDMGCGNGAFIEHIFEVVEQRTKRGKMLEEHPLLLVGVDYNQAALKVARANLIKSDIWAKIVWGDIGKPDLLAQNLKDDYGMDLHQLLNVRTFLDHNRIWSEPKVNTNRVSNSTGAFTYKGKRLNNNRVEDNLLEHFNKWAPYIKKFGLLVIELHTIAPELTASNLGKTPATAYDATHGFSDQYILEVDCFLNIAKEAGLFPDDRYAAKFPASELATVTVNLLKEK
jgi:hypothetical protein